MTTDKIAFFKKCFEQISIRELNERIANYQERVNLKTISEEHLTQELFSLFRVEINGQQSSFFIKSDTETSPHHLFHFYRIRKFSSQDKLGISTKIFESMQKEQDIWARPAADVNTMGRLNQVGESVFYAAAQVTNAIYETGCKEEDLFFLMVYKNKKQMRLSQIHANPYIQEFNELENAKNIILHNFLRGEFTKIVASGEEYKYKSSIAIYKQFFFSPYIDGFTYPSIKTQQNLGFNICFSAEKVKKNLTFNNLMVCKLYSRNDHEFQLFPIYDGFLNESGTFDFYPYNSSIAREKLGNFSMVRDMGIMK